MIKIIENKGFHLELANGVTLSAQIGSYNYCERRSFNLGYGNERILDLVESQDAEIMIWNSLDSAITHHFVSNCGDQVAGYISANQIANILGKLVTMTKEELDNLEPFKYPSFED